jgi:hypothetical protein
MRPIAHRSCLPLTTSQGPYQPYGCIRRFASGIQSAAREAVTEDKWLPERPVAAIAAGIT